MRPREAIARVAELLTGVSGHVGAVLLLAARNDDLSLLAKIKPSETGETAIAKEVFRQIWKIVNAFSKRDRHFICDTASVVTMFGLPSKISEVIKDIAHGAQGAEPVTSGVEPRYDDRPTAWVVRGLLPGSLHRAALMEAGMVEVLGSNDMEWPAPGQWPGGEFGPPNHITSE